MEISSWNKNGARLTTWNINKREISSSYLTAQADALPTGGMSFEGFGVATYLGNGRWRILSQFSGEFIEISSARLALTLNGF